MKYAPFWSRFFAVLVDMFMVVMPINIVVGIVFGFDKLKENDPIAGAVQTAILAAVTILFWAKTGQTPGKKALHIKVVDSKTRNLAPIWKLALRFFGYFLSMVTIVGFFIPKRALHDLISGTAVIEAD
jgi:uncharacterized RDD family membrane protein YckC